MKACRLTISNFRGVRSATLLLPTHGVLIGDNNTGKTTVFEALDLVLGVDRLNRQPAIDEHDFYRGKYRLNPGPAPDAVGAAAGPANAAAAALAEIAPPRIEIEVTVGDLNEQQKAQFGNFIEFWDSFTDTFYEGPTPEGVDPAHITEALRLTFHGWYDEEEDDFEGRTYFSRSLRSLVPRTSRILASHRILS